MKDDREKKGLSLESLYTERKNPLLHNETDKRLTEFIQERINKRLSKVKKEKAAAAKEATAIEGAEEEKAEEQEEEIAEVEEEPVEIKAMPMKKIIMDQLNFKGSSEIVDELVEFL